MKKLLYLSVPLLLLAIFVVRVFSFSNIQFDSDFGRDSLFAFRILHDKPTLLGAQASVGGFYLGPLYFYTVAAIFALFGPVPEMVMLFFALLNVLAAGIAWKLLSSRVSQRAGMIFLLLFAFAPMLITASRGATHMPMLPFITILVVTLLTRALEKNRFRDHFFSGLALGLFLHVHFSALPLFPGYFGAVLLLTRGSFIDRLKKLLPHLLALLIMASPLIAFDLRHGMITSKAFVQYLSSSVTGNTIREAFPHWSLGQKLLNLIIYLGQKSWLQGLAILGIILGIGVKLKTKGNNQLLLVLIYLVVSVTVLLLLYPGYLFSYYLIVPGVLVILLAAVLLSSLRGVGIVLALLISGINFTTPNSFYLPQFRTIANLTRITSVIEENQDHLGSPAFAVFKHSSDGMTGLAYEYRFLLTRDGYLPISEYSYEKAEVLYVVSETGKINPLNLGNFEVTQFKPKLAEKLATIQIRGQEVDIYQLTR